MTGPQRSPDAHDKSTGSGVSDIIIIVDHTTQRDPAFKQSLIARGLASARCCPPRDLDDVERDILAGSTRRIILTSRDDLLRAMWDERIDLDSWQKSGVRIEMLEPPAKPDSTDQPDISSALFTLAASWRDWNRGRRRRAAIGGIVFSILAIIAAFVVIAWK